MKEQVRFEERPLRYTDSLTLMVALCAVVNGYGTQRNAAKQLGISPQYLHEILAMKKPIPTRIAEQFGVTPKTIYVPKSEVQR